jgi:hypothetical protein
MELKKLHNPTHTYLTADKSNYFDLRDKIVATLN